MIWYGMVGMQDECYNRSIYLSVGRVYLRYLALGLGLGFGMVRYGSCESWENWGVVEVFFFFFFAWLLVCFGSK